MIGLFLAAPGAAASSGGFDLLQLLLQATGAVRAVLFLLVVLSIIGWYVIGYKAFSLGRATRESARFLDAFWQAKRLDEVYQNIEVYSRSPIAHMFKAGYVELSKIDPCNRTRSRVPARMCRSSTFCVTTRHWSCT